MQFLIIIISVRRNLNTISKLILVILSPRSAHLYHLNTADADDIHTLQDITNQLEHETKEKKKRMLARIGIKLFNSDCSVLISIPESLLLIEIDVLAGTDMKCSAAKC